MVNEIKLKVLQDSHYPLIESLNYEPEYLDRLLSDGYYTLLLDKFSGETFSTFAIKLKKYEHLKVIDKYRPCYHDEDDFKNTGFHYIALFGLVQLLRHSLKYYTGITKLLNHKNKFNQTLIFYAIIYNEVYFVNSLLRHFGEHINLNCVDNFNKTPFDYVTSQAMMRELLTYKKWTLNKEDTSKDLTSAIYEFPKYVSQPKGFNTLPVRPQYILTHTPDDLSHVMSEIYTKSKTPLSTPQNPSY